MERGRICRCFQKRPSRTKYSIAWSVCVADARAALRRYLEQRLELGEESIVLETMIASDVTSGRPMNRSGRQPVDGGSGAPVRIPDWRSALQASVPQPVD